MAFLHTYSDPWRLPRLNRLGHARHRSRLSGRHVQSENRFITLTNAEALHAIFQRNGDAVGRGSRHVADSMPDIAPVPFI
jgi:hypothetical protein